MNTKDLRTTLMGLAGIAAVVVSLFVKNQDTKNTLMVVAAALMGGGLTQASDSKGTAGVVNVLGGLVKTFTSSVTVSQPAVATLNDLPQAQVQEVHHDAPIPPMYEYDTATGEMRVNGVPVPVVRVDSPAKAQFVVPPNGFKYARNPDGSIDYGRVEPNDTPGNIKV